MVKNDITVKNILACHMYKVLSFLCMFLITRGKNFCKTSFHFVVFWNRTDILYQSQEHNYMYTTTELTL